MPTIDETIAKTRIDLQNNPKNEYEILLKLYEEGIEDGENAN